MALKENYIPEPRPVSFCLIHTAQGTMIVNRNDYVTTDRGSYGVGLDLLNDGQYDPKMYGFITALLDRLKNEKRPLTVLDCGANIGAMSVPIASHIFGFGNVYAFEPQNWPYYALCGNIALNNLYNATPFNYALGEKHEQIEVNVPPPTQPASYGSVSMHPEFSHDVFFGEGVMKKEIFQVVPLDDFGFSHIDLMKIDVEGAEISLLKGCRETIKIHKPIMLMEYIKGDNEAVLDFLLDNGYDFMKYEQGRDFVAWPKDKAHITDMIHSLATPETDWPGEAKRS